MLTPKAVTTAAAQFESYNVSVRGLARFWAEYPKMTITSRVEPMPTHCSGDGCGAVTVTFSIHSACHEQ